MIDAGEIFARIDSEKSMIRFLEEPEQYASAAMVDRLDQCIQQSVALSARVAKAEHAVRVPATLPVGGTETLQAPRRNGKACGNTRRTI